MSDAVFYVCVFVLIVLFWGEPDLHQSMMAYLSGEVCK